MRRMVSSDDAPPARRRDSPATRKALATLLIILLTGLLSGCRSSARRCNSACSSACCENQITSNTASPGNSAGRNTTPPSAQNQKSSTGQVQLAAYEQADSPKSESQQAEPRSAKPEELPIALGVAAEELT